MRSCLDSVGGAIEVSVCLPAYEVVRKESGTEKNGILAGGGLASPKIQVIPTEGMKSMFLSDSHQNKYLWNRLEFWGKRRERDNEHLGDVGCHKDYL